MGILINHVMSTDAYSSIFEDFIRRLVNGAPKWMEHQVSINPLEKADIYHFHRPQKCNILNIPKNSICTLHFDPMDLRQHTSIEDLFIRLSLFKKTVFLNKRTFENCRFLQNNRILIPHGYDQRLLLRREKKPHSGINIGFFSKKYNDGRKGEAYLFELYNNIFKKIEKKIYLVGSGWPDNLKLKSDRIVTIHPKNYENIIQLYSLIDMVLITSPYEGGPACLPESLAAGCQVFSTRCGMAEDILPEDNLLDFDTLSDALKIEKAFARINEIAQKDATQKIITWEEVSQKYNNLYQSLV